MPAKARQLQVSVVMIGHKRCWFCAQQRSPLTDEHVLAGAYFGAELVSPESICESCNSASGEVELLVAGGAWVAEATARGLLQGQD